MRHLFSLVDACDFSTRGAVRVSTAKMRNSWTRQRQTCLLSIAWLQGILNNQFPHSVFLMMTRPLAKPLAKNHLQTFWKFLCLIHRFLNFFNTSLEIFNFWHLTQSVSFLPLGEQNSPEAEKWVSSYLGDKVHCVSFVPFSSAKWRTRKPVQFWIRLPRALLWTGICVATHKPEKFRRNNPLLSSSVTRVIPAASKWVHKSLHAQF